MNLRFDYSGQAALVTGGTRDIGRAISEAFLRSGARVIATYAGNEDAARRFASENEACAGNLVLRRCDASDYAACEALFRELDPLLPDGLQILVNNAGIRRDAVLAMQKLEDWRAVIDANLTGTFHMSKFAVLSMLRKRYGRIICVTSPSGQLGFEGQSAYAASKAGQVGLARSLCKETASRGITVNCISPGFIDTDLLHGLSDKQKEQYRAQVPLKRFGTPAEVAACVLFLASREASYITGATLDATGGL